MVLYRLVLVPQGRGPGPAPRRPVPRHRVPPAIGCRSRATATERTAPMTATSTRWQLLGGVVATPLYFLVALALAFTRPGFDLSRHYLSQLSTGGLGWIQMANFVGVGALVVLCAAAMGRVLAPGLGTTWGPRLIGAFGAGLVAAGVFVADPANGYPPGYPEGAPTW